jgi:hypothetical protein
MNKRLSTSLLVVLKELNRSLVSFRGFPRAAKYQGCGGGRSSGPSCGSIGGIGRISVFESLPTSVNFDAQSKEGVDRGK